MVKKGNERRKEFQSGGTVHNLYILLKGEGRDIGLVGDVKELRKEIFVIKDHEDRITNLESTKVGWKMSMAAIIATIGVMATIMRLIN